MLLKVKITDLAAEPTVVNDDLIFRARNTNVISLICEDEELQRVDISSSTVFFTVKPTISTADASATLKKDVTSHTSPTAGETEITLTSTDTSSLSGNYIYSIKIKLSTGLIYTLAEGTILFSQELATRES
jgi:hypothetical protein